MNDVFRKNIATVVSEQPDAYMPHVLKVLQGKLDELDAKFGAKLDRERRILETFLTVKVNEVAVRIIDQLIDDKMSGIENKIGELVDTKLAFSHECPYRKAVDDVLQPDAAWHLGDEFVALPRFDLVPHDLAIVDAPIVVDNVTQVAATVAEIAPVPAAEVAEAEPIVADEAPDAATEIAEVTDETPAPAAATEPVVTDEAPPVSIVTHVPAIEIAGVAEADPIVTDEALVPPQIALAVTDEAPVAPAAATEPVVTDEAPPVSIVTHVPAIEIAGVAEADPIVTDEAPVAPAAAPEATPPDPKRKSRTISSRIQRRTQNPNQ